MSEDYSSIDYQMSILQAAKEGKAIEVCGRRYEKPSSEWSDRQRPDSPFNFAFNCYRVKKEPRKFRAWCRNGTGDLYSVLPEHDHKPWLDAGWELIELVEVLK